MLFGFSSVMLFGVGWGGGFLFGVGFGCVFSVSGPDSVRRVGYVAKRALGEGLGCSEAAGIRVNVLVIFGGFFGSFLCLGLDRSVFGAE